MSADQPLISVIVPVYNVEEYVGHCIQSILLQTYKDIEIILVNDGSTDSSGTICKEYAEKDDRIRYFEKENGGISDARNYALERSGGGGRTLLLLTRMIGWMKITSRLCITN